MNEPTMPPPVGREYTRDILDRMTGAVQTISLGQWITVTELGMLHGVGPRRVRTILREMDFVYAPGGGPKQAHRIASWAVEAGFGRRHERSKTIKHPFDVVSPSGQAWIAERWTDAVAAVEARDGQMPVANAKARLHQFKQGHNRLAMTVQEEVCWLADHLPALTQQHMAEALDVTQQLVSRYLRERAAQRAKWRAWRSSPPPEVPRLRAREVDELTTLWFAEVNNASSQHAEKQP